ncbi:cobalt-zinc-cadmium resistance protein CzcA [Fluviicoccus keumensis]|uniref:Cobalt-zinc-cadmium resistance protein CzcA n=1 Tax=Fluviicoccus keumensis TaxID=1435465 RepID=A0A4Q7ZBK7_9GAMM|nr:CusA/CzcA family heavy metal efflux RND transporter [Fluviicoccus keumensis]RZU47219.1 cobalt-zinc-cadmium resistance protein CzcA [Fluviicoccus keumensis]
MIDWLIRFSLAQRLLMAVLMAVLTGGGWLAFRSLPIDAFPDVSPTQVKIIMKAPGMTPEEVESRIAVPIEVEMLGIPHQQMLRSTSKYALVDITINFDEGTDIYWARQQVAERLGGISDQLPEGITGGLAPITTPLGEMFMFTVDGPQSLRERRELLDWVIRPALRTVPGVADVNALGGEVRSFEVAPDPAAMAALGVDVRQLRQVILENNRNDGAGRIQDGEDVLLVREAGAVQGIDDLKSMVVTVKDGVPVTVGQIADVRLGALTRYGAVTKDGRGEAVEGLVLGLAGANARSVVDGVRARLKEVGPSLPPGVKINVFYDRAGLVNKAVGTVAKALIEATVLVVVLLGLFLGNLRAALTVALVLPMSALITFILMRRFGMSANLMSLGGLAIAIGMLVDAAVVVVENIVAELSHHQHRRLPKMTQIYHAVKEVAAPVTSGILIIITVFLPLLTLEGLEGKLFAPVALTIVFALAGSLILSLTVIPVVSSWLIKADGHEEPWLPRQLLRFYTPLLNRAIARQKTVFAMAAVLLLVAVAGYTQVGKAFMPTMDEGDVIIGVEKAPTISLDESTRLDSRIQQALLKQVPEIAGIVARVGSDEIGLDPMGLNQTDTFLRLKPQEQWQVAGKEALLDKIRRVMEQFPGIDYSFTQPIEMRVSEMIIGVRGDLALKVYGPDLHELNRLARETEAVLKGLQGASDVYTLQNDGVQYLQVEIDRMAAGRLGVNVSDIQSALRVMVEGQKAGVVIDGNKRVPILVRGESDARLSETGFSRIYLTTPSGQSYPLSAVAKLQTSAGPVKVDREMGSRFSVVIANVSGRDLVGFVDEARQQVAAKVKIPAGYRLQWGGQFENQQRAAKRLSLVVPVALGLICILLFSTFGSLRQALLVLSNIPFALVGGILALWVTGEYLSVPASVGFIALLGIAVLNGVMLVSYFNQLVTNGMPLDEVIVVGTQRRLRPVMMTASITAFGLIPLLFAHGPGSEIQKPLAIVVIGGLVSATVLTLILLPLLYRRFGGVKEA